MIQGAIALTVLSIVLIVSMEEFGSVPRDYDSASLAGEKAWLTGAAEQLETVQPDVVIMGNSMAGYSVDEELFARISGRTTVNLWKNGASSAWYYLLLERLIIPTASPDTLIIVFRDNVLTRPDLRVWGQVKPYLDALMATPSPLVDELAYIRDRNADYYLFNYVPLYADRYVLNKLFTGAIQEFVGTKLLSIEAAELKESLDRTFSRGEIKYRNILEEGYYASTVLKAENLRFEENLRNSFLPHIVELCRQNGIHLVAVRLERLVDRENKRDTQLLQAYIDDFAGYARREGFTFIDFTGKPWLEWHHFTTNDHLKSSGKEQFTRVLFAELSKTERWRHDTGRP